MNPNVSLTTEYDNSRDYMSLDEEIYPEQISKKYGSLWDQLLSIRLVAF